MTNLLKYEFKRRKRMLISLSIVFVVAEALSIYLLFRDGPWEVFSVFINVMLFVTVLITAFLDAAVKYYSDFKKTQGTMLFLTPTSGQRIIGSKMIFSAVELFVGLLVASLFALLTNQVAVGAGYVGVQPIIEDIFSQLTLVFSGNTIIWSMIGFGFLVFLQYFASITAAITSVTVGRTMFSRNNYNWLFAILMFIVVSFVMQTVDTTVLLVIGLSDGLANQIFSNPETININIVKYLLVGGVQYTFWICAGFLVSSRLLNKRIDL